MNPNWHADINKKNFTHNSNIGTITGNKAAFLSCGETFHLHPPVSVLDHLMMCWCVFKLFFVCLEVHEPARVFVFTASLAWGRWWRQRPLPFRRGWCKSGQCCSALQPSQQHSCSCACNSLSYFGRRTTPLDRLSPIFPPSSFGTFPGDEPEPGAARLCPQRQVTEGKTTWHDGS